MMASSSNAPIAATIGIQTGKSPPCVPVARVKTRGGCRTVCTMWEVKSDLDMSLTLHTRKYSHVKSKIGMM